MQSSAVPTGSRSTASAGEAELARAAARRDGAAIADLVGSHAPMAWRLAQAVIPDPEASAVAVAEGCTRFLRSARHRRSFDPARFGVLAGTYRSALEAARSAGQDGRDAAALAARPATDPEAVAAFRSLPERWRAALWLHEVEGLPPIAVAASLDVSEAVAAQLLSRGRKALIARYPAGGAPGALPDALAGLPAPVPAGLVPLVAERVRAGLAADLGGLLGERATRPLATAAAGIIAVGVIGVGVLGGHAGVTGGPALRAAAAPGGTAAGVATGGSGLIDPIAAVGSLSPLAGQYPTLVGAGGSTLYGALTGALGSPSSGLYQVVGGGGAPASGGSGTSTGGAPGGGAAAPTPGAGGSGGAAGGAGGGGGAPGGSGGTGGSGGSGGSGGGPTTTVPAPVVPVTLPPVTLPVVPPTVSTPVATISNGGGSVAVTTPAAGLSVGTCTAVNLLGQTVNVACPTPTTAPSAGTSTPATTTTTVPLLGGILGGL